ncbi:MAG TPA: glycosyltransferase family 4 protein [Chitinophagaceae bacterium]|nr:glycosyltransferase family 4 protein [Chitinophagaceae bacterium]
MNRQLHIVCLDVPWPADYGGAIDMMNRIMMLKRLGIGIHLHYFSYNERGVPNELNQYCESIHVYERKTGRKGFSHKIPYIISSRINDDLVQNLNQDQHPILLEGIHCTGILPGVEYSSRKIVVRMHNEESVYYKELARSESSLFRKIFFLNESRLIRKYSYQLPEECTYACVSAEDMQTFREEYRLPKVEFLPTFPAWQKVNAEQGIGNLCLYHGNLSVPENEKAALWLLHNVFTKVRKPFVIAGKKPTRRLQKMAHLCQHTCLVADPTESEMDDLVRKAHIHVLPCFNKHITGIRLKLLHVLFEGRHCVVNEPMVKGTGLEDACHIAASSNAFASIITQLYNRPFTDDELLLRKRLLGDTYNNEKNTQQLIRWLW